MESAGNYENLDKPELISIISDQQRELDKLRQMIHNANRRQFGKKSEKLSKEQCALFSLEEQSQPEPESVTVKEHTREINRGRKPLPAGLPREQKFHEPEQRTCNCCGGELARIGAEITEELEYIPASFKVIEHVRIKRACPKCKTGVETGVLPAGVQALPGCRAGAGLLTQVVLS